MKKIITALLFLLPMYCFACRVSIYGNTEIENKADVVFEGLVVGVELTSYQEKLFDNYDEKTYEGGEYPILISDVTPGHLVSVYVLKVLKGNLKPNQIVKVNVGGCGVPEAKLRVEATFYLQTENNYALPSYAR